MYEQTENLKLKRSTGMRCEEEFPLGREIGRVPKTGKSCQF